MERRTLLPSAWTLLLLLLPVITGSALADPVAIPADALTQENELQQLLVEGRQLERQSRWGEALTHYEDAVRQYPNDAELKRRMVLARIHYDLNRRYADDSYLHLLQTLGEQQALDLFTEVGAKIQTHYVHAPDWNAILRRGTSYLQVALEQPDFRKIHNVQATQEQIDPALRRVWQVLGERNVQSRQQARDMVQWIGQVMQYHLQLPPVATILEYSCGSTGALDNYSSFLTGAQLDDVYSQIEGNFVGLGIELKAQDGTLLIAGVIPGGPADEAGLVPGDRITSVDGRSTTEVSTDSAADLLKGEEGTRVEVGVLSSTGETRTVQIRRARVEVPSVEDVRILASDSGVGYFRITSFQKNTSRDVDVALWKLHAQGMRTLIIDLRGNPGGLLTASVDVADRFITGGTIVRTKGRSSHENFDYKAHRVGTWRVPLVVLIDHDSASASEIFAGAIRDHGRGSVVGHRSYGKGSVQGIFPLRVIPGGLRLTTAKFYSPSGQAISDRGVEPDIPVEMRLKAVAHGPVATGTEDPVLRAGIIRAQQLVAQRTQSQPGQTSYATAQGSSAAGG